MSAGPELWNLGWTDLNIVKNDFGLLTRILLYVLTEVNLNIPFSIEIFKYHKSVLCLHKQIKTIIKLKSVEPQSSAVLSGEKF